MLQLGRLLAIGLMGAAMGCRDNTPPVPMVPPPAPGQETFRREYEPEKPLPPQGDETAALPRPFYDEPILVDQPPEAMRFVELYRQVGRPRIVVFVNRTLEGQLIPPSGPDAGPAKTMGQTEEYLRPGEYDEVQAKAIDYGMMETLLTDWMSADGKVSVISPLLARKKLSEQQIKDLQSGRQMAMRELAEQLDADVLIQVQTRITRQTPQGPAVRILAEAVNTQGADSLARAAVDMDPPLDKPQLNKYTRFLARKLMDQMAATWSGPGPGGAKNRVGGGGTPSPDKGLGPRLTPGEKPATQP